MEKARAESISARDFTSKLMAAVESALKSNPGFSVENPEVSFFPDPGVLGFILEDPGVRTKSFSELGKLTTDITAAVPSLRSKSAIILGDRGPILGFFPASEIALRE